MKFTVFVTEDIMQFNLEGETDAERKFAATLAAFGTGDVAVSVHPGVDLNLCQGGYIRNFGGNDDTVAVVIRRRPSEVR